MVSSESCGADCRHLDAGGVPRLLNYIVAIYLIIIGLVGLFRTAALHT
ncbi:MAG TPA: DUF3096 domain-containing protein [Steroidobacteraceae bacterium]|nr:DUF3096 domain-containing protein [Steroidobacteraceae bacterium]